jgi:hypothetical protein
MQQSLQTKHEELLALDEGNHPPYINSSHLNSYKALFKSHGFCCRFKSCPASDTGFPSTKARASHETEHFPTYRCKECDFSVRGFRSKGDLSNHINKYHTSAENIELPAELLPSSPQPGQAPPTSNKSVSQNKQQIPPPDPMPGAAQFGDPNFPDQAFNLDFSKFDTSDVLNDFDFDSFLNADDGSNWQLGPDDLISNTFGNGDS